MIIPFKEMYDTTKIEEHFWIKGKCFELRKLQSGGDGHGDWTWLGVYCIEDDDSVVEINVHFLETYLMCEDNPLIARLRLDEAIERDITKYLRFNHHIKRRA